MIKNPLQDFGRILPTSFRTGIGQSASAFEFTPLSSMAKMILRDSNTLI